MIAQLLIGLLAAGLVSTLAAKAGALRRSGAIAAVLVGAPVYAAGGITWSALLLVFFLSGSALSRLPTPHGGRIVEKTGGRDWAQVFANGGAPALIAAASLFHPLDLWSTAFAGSLAAATGDTWATEIGSRASGSALQITTLRPVPAGTSGGISLPGTVAAATGALVLAAAAIFFAPAVNWPVVAVSGFAGSVIDSLLGATLQEVRYCPVCGAETEQRLHAPCGTRTTWLRGLRFMNNDAVNLLATATAAVLALGGASL